MDSSEQLVTFLRGSFEVIGQPGKVTLKAVRLLKGDNKTIPTLVVDDHEVTSDSEKVEVLSDHFAKSFNNSLPPLSPVDVESIEVDPNSCP